jgi:cellulose synthase/poly-beta-1,6-N-acetylglucosamine synthase-like glycosyltransferase
MSDANTMFAPDAIRKLARHFVDPQVGCVSGELLLEHEGGVSGEGLYWKYEGWIKRNESRLGFLIGCNGGIYALRRALYQPLPTSTIVDDFVLSMRVLEQGYRVCFEPEARATEPAAASARAEMVRKIRIGAGGFQALGLTRRLLHPRYGASAFAFWGHKVLRWCVPLLFLAALVANVALVGVGFYQAVLGLQLVGVLVAGRAYTLRAGRVLPRWTRPISYFYLMNFALLCGFFRFVFRTQRVTWERAVPEPVSRRTLR